MNIIAIGDLHGKTCWETVDSRPYDKIIFMGDYVDSLVVSGEQIIANLENVIEFKKALPDKVVLLLGNHDIVYSEFPEFECYGFMKKYQEPITALFQANADLFQVAWQDKNHLFTHAGVSNGFYRDTISADVQQLSLADHLNQVHRTVDRRTIHVVSTRRGGYYRYGGITWADMEETREDFLDGFYQIVGHTRVPDFKTFQKPGASITYVNVLDFETRFYTLEI